MKDIIEHYNIQPAKIPNHGWKVYRLGDVLLCLGVGISAEQRVDMFEADAAEHDKREKRRDIERSLRF